MWPGASQSSIYNAAAALVIAALVIAALYLGRAFIIPLALAGFFSFVLHPAVHRLEQFGAPRALGATAVVFALLVALGIVATVLAREVSHFAEELPRYEQNLRTKVRDAKSLFQHTSIWRGATELWRRTGEKNESSSGTADRPLKVEVQDDRVSVLGRAATFLQSSLSPLASTGLALLFTFFILLQYLDLRDRVIRLMGSGEVARATQALNDAAVGLAHFFRLQVALNISFGVLIGACLWLIGVPNPALWGVLAAVLRFVPYVGGFISAALPLAVAAAVEPTWTKFLLTAALFAVAELTVAQVAEPLLFGRRTRLSPLAVILAAAFWTTLWGPVGLLLAMPITLSLVVFADHIPMLSFFRIMLGNEPALRPEEQLYHRLLAGDAASAVEQAYSWLEERYTLVGYLDSVALPALAIAAMDQRRGVLRPEKLDQLRRAISEFVGLVRDLVEELIEERSEEGYEDGHAQALVIAARGPFDQAAAELLCLASRLDGKVSMTCPTGGGLLAISAAAADPETEGVECAALLSVGGATRYQLGLLAKRMRERLPHSELLLLSIERNHSNSVGDSPSDTHAADDLPLKLSGSSRSLLDDIESCRLRRATLAAGDGREVQLQTVSQG